MAWLKLTVLLNAKPDESHGHHGEDDHDCGSLCCGRSGQQLKIVELQNHPDEAAKLRDLGLREGVHVTVSCSGDPLIVGVGDARFGIARSAAVRIQCQEG